MARYKLKLKKLNFISAVDEPAQETARALLFKRAGGVKGLARVAKLDDELGLVFCWAFTSKSKGDDYYDLHGDCIEEGDIVRVAADFMEGARAVDQMHDREQTGQVVFAMPMTAEVAKAFGVTTDTTGLMIAIKPGAEAYAKFKSGDYTGVSIDGVGIREPATKRAAPVAKQALVTTETLGHQHLIDLACMDDSGCGQTSYQTAEGAEYGHTHAWARSTEGSLTILADGGHTHELASGDAVIVVPADAVVVVATESGVTARSPARTKSTQPTVAHTVVKQSPPHVEPKMDPKDLEIADLKKRNAELERLADLSDGERGHWQALKGADAAAFLAKTAAARAAELAEIAKADEVVYTSPTTGESFRKSDDKRLVEMAKRQDAQAAELVKAKAAGEAAIYKARAKDEIGNLAGDTDTKVALLKAVDGIADEKVREAAVTALKAADAAMVDFAKAKGVNPGAELAADSPEAELEALAKKLATEQKVDIAKARGLVFDTAEGAALYGQIEKRRADARAAGLRA